MWHSPGRPDARSEIRLCGLDVGVALLVASEDAQTRMRKRSLNRRPESSRRLNCAGGRGQLNCRT